MTKPVALGLGVLATMLVTGAALFQYGQGEAGIGRVLGAASIGVVVLVAVARAPQRSPGDEDPRLAARRRGVGGAVVLLLAVGVVIGLVVGSG